MKRPLLFALACVLALTLTACFKSEIKVTVSNDATGTINMKMGYSVETLEAIAETLENIPEGLDIPADPLEQLEEMEQSFTEKTVVSGLKEAGVEVTSSKQYEKDGYKNVEAAGKIKDINAWVTATSKASKVDSPEASESPMKAISSSFTGLKFFKTNKEGVGEVEIKPPLDAEALGEAGMPPGMDPDEIPEGMEEMMEAAFDSMKERFGLNQLSLKITVVLPGKVLTTTACKKNPQNEREVTFTLDGSAFTMAGMKDMFGLQKGVSATFEIPKDCKVKFQVKQPKKKAEKKADKKDDAKKKKKGGLGIGENGDK